MEYRRLGRSNLRVSRLCLGTMMFADQTGLDEAADMMAWARDHGFNFIDTADLYSKGGSETMLGRLLAGGRDDWVLASKLGNAVKGVPNTGHYSRQWMHRAVRGSLQRLGTDHLDILYLHRDYIDENLEEAVRGIEDLTRAGHIRSFALSNFRGWRIAEIMRLCQQANIAPPIACQPYYNLLNRVAEVEILPACMHYGLGVVPYSPIARGVLTGKYAPGATPPPDTRAGRNDLRIMQTEFREESLRIAIQLQAHAEARGITPGQFATAWVLANQAVSSVIVGPRTLAQLKDYLPALDVTLSAGEEAMVDALVVPGHNSAPGYNDPGHPFHGRPLSSELAI